ncbi:histidine phosphatase family protein [Streptomyces scopuliridis]|uniref:histidine phosphatase family protein n=1 Tax=Streptomyces scopuliridis TaxID=452529 RepID=UPI0036960EDD
MLTRSPVSPAKATRRPKSSTPFVSSTLFIRPDATGRAGAPSACTASSRTAPTPSRPALLQPDSPELPAASPARYRWTDIPGTLTTRHGHSTRPSARPARSVSSSVPQSGRRQAVPLGQRLQSTPLSAIYLGPLPRAQQTAQLISAQRDAVPLHPSEPAGDYVPNLPTEEEPATAVLPRPAEPCRWRPIATTDREAALRAGRAALGWTVKERGRGRPAGTAPPRRCAAP